MREPDRTPKGAWLPAGALILVMAIGLLSAGLVLLSPKGDLWRDGVSWVKLGDGRETSALAKLLNKELLGGHGMATAARALDWLVLGDLGGKVRLGCENWLFLNEELEVHPHSRENLAHRAAIVARIEARLTARGIALMVAVVPDKSRIEAAHLCGVDRPAVLASRLENFEGMLSRSGIAWADLDKALSRLDGERYYRTDSHWNERGAAAAAAAVAARLRQDRTAPAEQGDARIIPGMLHERVGDLIRLAGLDSVSPPFRPVGDLDVAESRIEMPESGGNDLLGNSSGPPIVVIGSSFSRNANFVGFLAYDLKVPIASMAKDGAGFSGSAISYFANPAYRDSPPQTIVWEMPERALDRPLSRKEAAWGSELGLGP